jgi:GNAT superfamily N-acetyltransferase
MPGLEIVPFADEHLDAAAALLAERHHRHRAAEPLLPDGLDFRAEIAALRDVGAEGVAGFSGGRVVGYVLGVRKPDGVWGPNVWVEAAGHAVETAEDARDLYAAAADAWVAADRTRHYVLLPATDRDLVDAWFRLGFGAQHAHGVREVPDVPALEPLPGVTIRAARAEDVEAADVLGPALGKHQALSPVFAPAPADDADDQRAEWLEEAADEDAGMLVAERDGRLVSLFTVAPVEYSRTHAGLARPTGACILGYAATLPGARGGGVGRALTDAVFAWARQRGYHTIVVDWRVTNLLSSRFWPQRGFRTTFLRLHRSIP